MQFSSFADKFARQSGIGLLMDDLTDALRGGKKTLMLGGGAPSHIPQVEKVFRKSMQLLMADGMKFERAIGNYGPPQGSADFIEAFVQLLNHQYGWTLTPGNVALTHGSQQAFFVLFNMFAGPYPDGSHKKILFPMAPEYIGYCDVGLEENLFESVVPSVEMLDELFFKYRINFDSLHIHDGIGAVCVSRPTNPTGNVLTDDEIIKLAQLAKARQIPLIIDNAYGKPFPDIIFTDGNPYWDDNCIICMSLSKLGMPGTRTGIVIGPEEVIRRVSRMNAVISLSPGGMGTAIATEMVRSGGILSMCRQHVQPFYREKMEVAVSLARRSFRGLNIAIHKPEGAFFLWVWFKDLTMTCDQLYRRLKEKGVVVVPGHSFFFGLRDEHPHRNQCLRINHAQNKDQVQTAFQIIADEAAKGKE